MSELREAAKEALRWMEHARLHLTIKERMHPDGLSLYDSAAEALRAALAKPETDAGVSWDGHNVRGDADSIAEVRRLIDFEQARQGAKPATGDDLRVYDAIAANYVNAEPEPVVIGPEWTPCVKLPVTVHVREQRPGEQHVSTREGITPVKPDDLIMRGVAGEEYPIGRELFGRTYRIGANPPRDEWRPASEPPDSDRDVQAWIKIDLSELDGVVTEQCDAQAFYEDGAWHVRGPDHDGWMQLCPGHMVSVVVWRDVTPPTTEGE